MPTTNEELERVTKEIHDELDRQRAECARKIRNILDRGEEIDPSVADLNLGGAAARFTKKPNVAKKT
jgi:hypothetical protein